MAEAEAEASRQASRQGTIKLATYRTMLLHRSNGLLARFFFLPFLILLIFLPATQPVHCLHQTEGSRAIALPHPAPSSEFRAVSSNSPVDILVVSTSPTRNNRKKKGAHSDIMRGKVLASLCLSSTVSHAPETSFHQSSTTCQTGTRLARSSSSWLTCMGLCQLQIINIIANVSSVRSSSKPL